MLLAVTAYPMIISTHPSLLINPLIIHPVQAFIAHQQQHHNHTLIDQTFLPLAKIDASGSEMEKQASSLLNKLQNSWVSASRGLQGARWRTDDLPSQHIGSEHLPAQLFTPKYAGFWPQFGASLQNWVKAKGFDPHIMSSLMQTVKGPIDRHYLKKGKYDVVLNRKYRTCAVVGNSGILLNQSHASFIDSHDMVIRLNNARTIGFQDRVGSKTTIAFINSNILQACGRRNRCACHPYGESVPIVLYLCQLVHLMDVAFCSSSHEAPIIVTDPRFDAMCSRIVKYYSIRNYVESTGERPEAWSEAHDGPMFHYSSGMQAVMLALGICDRVSIFGFGKVAGMKHHYHTSQQGELHLHDYTAEYQFYHDLVHNRSSAIPFLSEAGFVLPSVQLYL